MPQWESDITPEQRELIRAYVRHEWRMVQQLNQVLIELFFGDLKLEWCISTAVLDSLLIHARNLHDFFCRQATRKGDVTVGHLLPVQHANWHPSGMDTLATSIDSINKLFTHLTYERIDRDVSWHANRLREEIDAAFEQFLALLPESERDFWQA